MARESSDIIGSYRELPLGKWLHEVLPLCDGTDPVETKAAVIGVLTGRTAKEVLALPIAQFAAYAAVAEFLTLPPDTSRAGRAAARYDLGDFVLVPRCDPDKISAAQFIDFQTLSRDVDKDPAAVLSVFLVPEGKAYNDGYDIREVQRAIEDLLSVQDAMELLAFFFSRFVACLPASLTSSEKAIRGVKDRRTRKALRERLKEVAALLRSGAGLPT